METRPKSKSSIRYDYLISEEDIVVEKWKSCFFIDKGVEYDYRGIYEVSDMGRVRSFKKKQWNGANKGMDIKYLTVWMGYGGYLNVHLNKCGKRRQIGLHRIVALIHIPNPEKKLEVNHKFKIKTDCRASQLEWVTPSENRKHCLSFGDVLPVMKGKFGKDHNQSIPISQFDMQGNLIASFESIIEAHQKTRIAKNRLHSAECRKNINGYVWIIQKR